MTNETTKHEIKNNGFSNLVTSEGIYICIVVRKNGIFNDYEVHMRHGSPAGAFWKNGGAINRFKTMTEACDLVDRLAGLVDAHKSFPVIHAN